MLRKYSSLIMSFVLAFSSAMAMASSDYNVEKLNEVVEKLKETGTDATLIAAVNKQNAQNLSMSTISSRDKKWQGTSGLDDFMKTLMSNSAAKRLARIEKENKVIVESFLMDKKGANVAMTNKTSDYWQGDEAKFTKSFNGGKGSVHLGKAKFDKSAQAYVVQVSVPVLSAGRAIGAITYGINIDDLN
jgi:hypothetical protein